MIIYIYIKGTGAGFEAGGLRVGQIILGVDGVNMQGSNSLYDLLIDFLIIDLIND